MVKNIKHIHGPDFDSLKTLHSSPWGQAMGCLLWGLGRILTAFKWHWAVCGYWWFHQRFRNRHILYHLLIKTQKGLISYQLPASWGCILKFPSNKKIHDGTHSQCSGTHKDHGLWVPGTHEEVNNFESLFHLVAFCRLRYDCWRPCCFLYQCCLLWSWWERYVGGHR